MYLVMRQRVAKMEARVDERLNQVNGLNSTFEVHTLSSLSGRIDALRNFAAAGQVVGSTRAAECGPGHS
jgi:tRNA(Phe) wybutosine-synthesizing methylase Tyw3